MYNVYARNTIMIIICIYSIELYIIYTIIYIMPHYYIGNDMISQVPIYIVCYIKVGILLIEYSRGRRYVPE